MRPVRDTNDAVMALEATITRQLLQASKAFTGGDTPGSQIRTDMFIETLADAIAEGGGLGLGPMLQQALGEKETAVDLRKLNEAAPLAPLRGTINNSLPEGGAWRQQVLPAHAPSEATARVTSEFGKRSDPLEGDARFHTGVDMAAPVGTSVLSALDGIVKTAGNRGGYGKAVEIDHGNGVTTLYAHNSEVAVKPGELVKAGQIIAEVGQSGRATGPHLHLEVRLDGKPTNPRSALNAYQIRVEDTLAAPLPLSPKK
ncbi:MAG: M23 family metallopeptidase [Deltaproteobacteria bacterium]|nr:M23 family metallopeptidase [Deltaproteobacteria bacterium]